MTVEDVDCVFEALLDPVHRAYFDFWRQRLHAELGLPDSKYAMDLLSAVAGDDEGVSRATLLYLAVQAVEAGSPDYLRRAAPEMRAPALSILKRIAPRLGE